MIHTYNISGMTCMNCVSKVKSELLKLGDITSADIQLSSPQASLQMTKHIPTSLLQQAVHKAGNYAITEASVEMVNGTSHDESMPSANSYFPIFLIFGMITISTALVQVVSGEWNWMQWMSHFMAGFFLVFSFFKLMNLQGFVEGYQTYDVLASRFPAWGYVYPFIELVLGLAFLVGFQPLLTNLVTLAVMSIGSIGVIQSMIKNSPIQCACLGTVIKLPLGKVTLFEGMLMVAMSAIMILSTI